jgi:hypothetical protein
VTTKLTIRCLLLIVLSISLLACRPEADFVKMHDLPTTGWEQESPVHIFYTAADSLQYYRMGIEGRLLHSYFPDQLSLELQITTPSGTYFCDTLSSPLQASSDRPWTDFRLPYYRKIRFSETGEWRFSIKQNMNVSTIMGIASIGIYIEKDGKE